MSFLFGGGSSVQQKGPTPGEIMQMQMLQQAQSAYQQASSGKAEEEALAKRRALAGKGMEGTILGGETGDASNLLKKKLLGG